MENQIRQLTFIVEQLAKMIDKDYYIAENDYGKLVLRSTKDKHLN